MKVFTCSKHNYSGIDSPCPDCADGGYAVLSDGRAVAQKEDEWMCVSGTIWMKGDSLVITGCPKTEEHNCDAMGCGSLDHIILRAKVNSNGI